MPKFFKPVMTLMAVLAFSAPVAAASHDHDHDAVAPATGTTLVGNPAPDFTATAIDGASVKLSDLKGKIVVLEWNNPECPFVIKHYGSKNMQKLQTEATSKDDLVWLTINSGAKDLQGHLTAEQAQDYVTKQDAKPSHYILDDSGEIGKLYQAKTTPHMFVIDKEGVLAYAGAIDNDPTPRQNNIDKAQNYVMAAVEALREGKKIEVATSQPYGCGVKYGQ